MLQPKTKTKAQEILSQNRPEPVKGINLVSKPEGKPVLQKITASTLKQGQEALWIDGGNQASATPLLTQGGSDILERVRIARAFTPFQHHKLIQDIEKHIQNTEILVLSSITKLYRESSLKDHEKEELFLETWQKIQETQNKHKLKVLITAPHDSGLTLYIEQKADNKIEVTQNQQGLSYKSENFRTQFYTTQNNLVQTTIPYWSTKKQEKSVPVIK